MSSTDRSAEQHTSTDGSPTVGLMVELTAKEGAADALIDFFRQAVPDAIDEEGTLTWMVVRSGPQTFHILDTFTDDDGRRAHIHGVIADRLREIGPGLLDHVRRVPTDVVAFMPSAA